jgi:flagellar hook-associated protein 2
MSTSSINSLLSSLLNSNTTSSLTGNTTTNSALEAIQTAVNSILNSATNTSGSGIDVTATVDAILEADAVPEENLQNQETTLNTQTAALKTIESDLEAFQTSVQALSDPAGALDAVDVTSSNDDVLSATAANGTATGTHTITVSSLATTAAVYSADFSSASATLPTGSFDILVGPESDTNQPVPIPVDSTDGTDTLNGLATYINQQDLGVTASVITDAGGARLALVSQTSGAAGAVTTSSDTTGSGDGMGFTQATDANGNPLGTNASLTVDGIPITSASNTVTGVIPGVTLTLSGVSSSPVTIAIQPDLTQVSTAINNFVSSYNTVMNDINAQYSYDGSSSSTVPPLLGDPSLDLLQQQLLDGISTSLSGNDGAVNLQSIGIQLQADGTLVVQATTSKDSMPLDDALANDFSAVQNLFQSPSGVAQTLNTALTSLTNSVTGPLNVDMTNIGGEVTDLNSQISDFQANLQTQQQQLTTEYANINTTLEQLPETLAAINSELDALNPQNPT